KFLTMEKSFSLTTQRVKILKRTIKDLLEDKTTDKKIIERKIILLIAKYEREASKKGAQLPGLYHLSRHEFCTKITWGLPTTKTVKAVSSFIGDKTTLDIGSGHGLWARLLMDRGCKIISVDPFSF